jgi:hypothetical protein
MEESAKANLVRFSAGSATWASRDGERDRKRSGELQS